MGEALRIHVAGVINSVPYFIVLFACLLLGKLFYDRTTKFSFDHELTHRDNYAFGTQFSLYLLGLIFAIGGTLFRGSDFSWGDLTLVILFSLLAIVLMRLSVWMTDRFILPQFSIDKEIIKDRNVGTGFVVGGCLVATGLVINGALQGEVRGDSWGVVVVKALGDTLIFFVVGQAALLLGAKLYQWVSDYDVHDTIEKHDNLAAGLSYGGFLVGVGIVVRSGLVNIVVPADLLTPAEGVLVQIIGGAVSIALGVFLLWVARVYADKLLLSKSPLTKEIVEDRNPAAGAVEACCYICAALAFTWATAI